MVKKPRAQYFIIILYCICIWIQEPKNIFMASNNRVIYIIVQGAQKPIRIYLDRK